MPSLTNEMYLERWGDVLNDAWTQYLRCKEDGLEEKAAEQRAMMIVRPDDSQRSRLLKTWKNRELWPVTAMPEKGQIDLHDQFRPWHQTPAPVESDTPIAETPDATEDAEETPERDDRYEQSQRTDTAETPGHTEHAIPEEITKHMSDVARAVFQEFMKGLHTGVIVPTEIELPPEPPRAVGRGLRTTRDYKRITISLDQTIADIIDERASEQRLTFSRYVEALLWHALGKPDLSYFPRDGPDE